MMTSNGLLRVRRTAVPGAVEAAGIIDVTTRLSGAAVITVGSASTGATRGAGEGSASGEISAQSAAAAWVRGVVAGLVEVSSIGHGRVGQRKVDGDVSVVTLLREISACPPRLEAVARSSHVQVCASTGSRAIVATSRLNQVSVATTNHAAAAIE